MITMAPVSYILFLMSTLSFTSYNSRGLGAGRMDYIHKLTDGHDFVFIQEHWQLTSQLSIFQDQIPGICSHATSANNDSQLLSGRGFGECAILWNAKLNLLITPIDWRNDRICAVRVKSSDGQSEFALFSVYMPIDTRHDRENVAVYNGVLNDIMAVCQAVF